MRRFSSLRHVALSTGACVFLSLCVAGAVPAKSKVPAGAAPTLVALKTELDRSMKGLRKKGDPPPYFISYHVTESDSFTLTGANGALSNEHHERSRYLDIDVRVGSYALDNSRQLRGDYYDGWRNYTGVALLPVEEDIDAMRATLWLETDKAYKSARERYIQVKTNTAVKVEAEDTSADFSREKPYQHIGATVERQLSADDWRDRVREYSALFQNYAGLMDSGVAIIADAENRYFVNSEGTIVQHGHTHYRIGIYALAKADDGMDLQQYHSFDAQSLDKLPTDAEIRAAIDTVATDILALKKAPVIEPYTGPAILGGQAAGVFFHEIFGHRIEGHRQKNEDEGQTFTKMIGKPVLPPFLSVYSDPTRRTYAGTDLNGYYTYDDEGVKARPVTVVDDGVLRNFLMSRSPVEGFAHSNGHGRKSPGFRPVGRQANLIVESSSTVSEDELRAMLIAETKRQGKPFGLWFKDISGGFTFTGRYIPNAYVVKPILVYRVYADGRPDELVRGADLIGTPLISFSKILAAGDAPEVFNGVCGAESGWVPVSAIAPSLLTAQMEIQKKEKSSDRPPLLPPPPVAGGAQ